MLGLQLQQETTTHVGFAPGIDGSLNLQSDILRYPQACHLFNSLSLYIYIYYIY